VILVSTHDRLKVPTISEFYRLVQEELIVDS
jgi:hypothetical protein